MVIISFNLLDLLKFMMESPLNYFGTLIVIGFVVFIVSGFVSVLIQKTGQVITAAILMNKDNYPNNKKIEDND